MARSQDTGGPQPLSFDDRWNAVNSSFDDRWGALHPSEPNIPAYEPANISKPVPPGTTTFPPPWGGNGRITQMNQNPMVSALQGPANPAMSALFAHPAQHLQHMAGDVIPGPGIWESHISMPEPFRPRREGGVAGMLKMDPSHVDPSNVAIWPHGIPANQSFPWNE